jgi:hypothetical protein
MLVSDLEDTLETRGERFIETTLGNIEVAPDASCLTLADTQERFPFDDLALAHLARYLGLNKSDLKKFPDDLKHTVLSRFLDMGRDKSVVLEAARDDITSIHKPGLMLIPISAVAEIITRMFSPTDEVANLYRDEKKLHVDIKTSHHIEVDNPDRIEGRPEVGDITHGGVRMLVYRDPAEPVAPTVTTYLHRLFCSNGMAEDYGANAIHLRGKNVPEVLEEMEQAAQKVMAELDQKLASYAALNERPLPEDRTLFVHQLANEWNLGARITHKIVLAVAVLPDNATLYDVQNAFTAAANANISYHTSNQLQQLGGALAFDTDRVTHRCNQCLRLLTG